MRDTGTTSPAQHPGPAETPRAGPAQAGSVLDLIALTRRRDLAAITALMAVTSLTEGVGVLALVPILASLEGTDRRPPWLAWLAEAGGVTPGIGTLLAATLGIAIARTVLTHVQTIRTARMRDDLVDRLRVAAFAGVIRAEWRWLAQSRSSTFGNLIVTNANHVGFGLMSILQLASMTIVGATYVAASLVLSWPTALLTFLIGGTVLAAFAGERRRALAVGQALGRTRALLHEFVQQGFAGVRLIKAFGLEQARIADFTSAVDRIREQVERYERAFSRSQCALQVGGLVVLAGMVYVGHVLLHVALPTLLPLMFVFARLVPLVGGIQQNLSSWHHVRPALIETLRLIAEADEAREVPADPKRPPIGLARALTLDRVGVTYQGRDVPALDAVSLTLRANTTTALCGPSGAGKSTLADVVMGLIAPDAGTVAVDDQTIRGEGRVRWRRSIAYVQQDAFLFHDSIRSNILLDRRDAVGDDDLLRALTRAGGEFVLRLPQGLDTIVGDGGVRLSGGERQRVALARALIGRPALVILDEATSALDPESEREVRRTMAALRGTVTLLVISHRGSMQEDADQVVELDGGTLRVIKPYAQGTGETARGAVEPSEIAKG